MLTLRLAAFIINNINAKEVREMNHKQSYNFIVVLINLISLVIINGANKAYCGCAGGHD